MTRWYGREMKEGAHPDRPWWTQFKSGFRRSDGWLAFSYPDRGADAYRPGVRGIAHADVVNAELAKVDPGGGGRGARHASLEKVLAWVDENHPLAPPAMPVVGQVWVSVPPGSTPSELPGATYMLLFVEVAPTTWTEDERGRPSDVTWRVTAGAQTLTMGPRGEDSWPPANAVLVDGPGAPWMPMVTGP